MARATGSWSKAARSALDPPPRTTTMTSSGSACSLEMAAATLAGAPLPWTEVGATRDLEGHARAAQAAEEVVEALGARAGHQSDPEREHGHGEPTLAVEEVLVDQRLDQSGPLGGDLAQQGVGVQLGEDEVDGAPGLVELDLAPGPHHHAGVEGDAQPVEGGANAAPLGGPALDVERRGATVLGVGRVDQVDEAVALGQDLDRPDLPGDPELLGEGRPEGPVDPAVELGDGERVGTGPLGRRQAGSGHG